jgi:hypothetical protein
MAFFTGYSAGVVRFFSDATSTCSVATSRWIVPTDRDTGRDEQGSACQCNDVSQEPGCRASRLSMRFTRAKICLQSPRPMRFLPQKGECCNGWESLIFQKRFKLSAPVPIDPGRQHTVVAPKKRTSNSRFFFSLSSKESGDPVPRPLGFFALGLLRQGPAADRWAARSRRHLTRVSLPALVYPG